MKRVTGSNPHLELGNLSTVPGDTRWPVDGPYRGVPQLTAVDPLLQHADSTMVVSCCRVRGAATRIVVVSKGARVEKAGSFLSQTF